MPASPSASEGNDSRARRAKRRARLLGPAAGIAAVVQYVLLAAAAAILYPGTFGPATSWLSDLGNMLLNPGAAWLYRAAGIVGGAALFVFFRGLTGPGVLLRLAGIFGSAAGICFALTGVFSEDLMPMHSWFSIANFAAFGTSAALAGIAILRGAPLPRWLAVPCFAVWGVDVASAFFGQVRFLEWILVGLLLVFVTGVAAAQAIKVAREGRLG